jgi:hypothetical protein
MFTNGSLSPRSAEAHPDSLRRGAGSFKRVLGGSHADSEQSDRCGNLWASLLLLLLLLALQQEALRKVLALSQFLDLSLYGIQNIKCIRCYGR